MARFHAQNGSNVRPQPVFHLRWLDHRAPLELIKLGEQIRVPGKRLRRIIDTEQPGAHFPRQRRVNPALGVDHVLPRPLLIPFREPKIQDVRLELLLIGKVVVDPVEIGAAVAERQLERIQPPFLIRDEKRIAAVIVGVRFPVPRFLEGDFSGLSFISWMKDDCCASESPASVSVSEPETVSDAASRRCCS